MTLKNKLALSLISVVLLTAVILRILGSAGYLTADPDEKKFFILHENRSYPVLTAFSPLEQFTGLSGRNDLGQYSGMYFRFGRVADYTMVMRDMLFPLDIIWLRDNIIVDIKENLLPQPGVAEESLVRYTGIYPADAVLELTAGTVMKWQIKKGQKIYLCDFKGVCSR